jgi:hypothetical protein
MIVSERLRHATIGLTLDACSHTLTGIHSDAIDNLDAMLGKPHKSA